MRVAILVCVLALFAFAASASPHICDDSVPELFKFTNCTTCLSSLCTCIGGTYVANGGECTLPDPATKSCSATLTCVSTFKSCVVKKAQDAANASSTDECENWGAPLQTQLLAYLANNNTAYTTLQTACEKMVCNIYNASNQDGCSDPSTSICENFSSSSSIVSTLVAVVVAIVAAALTL